MHACIACFNILGDASMHSCMQMNLSGISLLVLKHTGWPVTKIFEKLPNSRQNPRNAKLILTLIYSMGDKADDILADERKQYTTVKEKFDRYFVKKHNVIFERAKFNSRCQRKGETVDDFITDLHCLAEHCAYGELHSEMIRDRIVVGLQFLWPAKARQFTSNKRHIP